MTNDDKQFFKGLITDLEHRLDQKWDGKFSELDQKWDSKFGRFKDELSQEIRYNGILIEDMQRDVKFLSKEILDFNLKLSEVKTDVAEIKEMISDYPIVRKLVQKHEKQLAKMR